MNPSTISTQKRCFTPRYRHGNPIWDYFYIEYEDTVYAECLACENRYSRGTSSKNTTNLRTHLKNKHPQLFEELLQRCQDQKNEANKPVVDDDISLVDMDNDHNDDTFEDMDDKNDDMSYDGDDDFFDAPEPAAENYDFEEPIYHDQSATIATAIEPQNTVTCQALVLYQAPHENFNESQQQSSNHSQEQQSSNHQPYTSMNEEELRRRLLIAQIQAEEAKTRYFTACTAALSSNSYNH